MEFLQGHRSSMKNLVRKIINRNSINSCLQQILIKSALIARSKNKCQKASITGTANWTIILILPGSQFKTRVPIKEYRFLNLILSIQQELRLGPPLALQLENNMIMVRIIFIPCMMLTIIITLANRITKSTMRINNVSPNH